MRELDVDRGGRVLRVRDAGAPDGRPVLHLHGTPSSRLEVAWGEDAAARLGVRLVSFDRPGYGHSTPARFSLTSIARDAEAIADLLGIERFATLGQSGGGPFALAAAAVLGDRVTAVGVSSGAAPFPLVEGGVDLLDDNDRAALALLPHDPEAAARVFAQGFQPRVEWLPTATSADVLAVFEPVLSARDVALVREPAVGEAVVATVRESLRQGAMGGGWDNVCWVGTWEVDLDAVRCPVHLWYGEDDRVLAPVAFGTWLRDHLPDARLVVRAGEGHFGFLEHLEEMLDRLAPPADLP